ncbi:hypothetical protein ACS0TY_019195 [Phlomoides rotata]
MVNNMEHHWWKRNGIVMYGSQTKYQIVLTKTDLMFPIDVARRAMQIEENLKAKKSVVQPLVCTLLVTSFFTCQFNFHNTNKRCLKTTDDGKLDNLEERRVEVTWMAHISPRLI